MKQKKLLLLPFLFLCSLLYAQNKIVSPDTKSTWVLDKTENNVSFYHKIEICNNQKVVFLKLNNRNAYKVEISWKNVFTTRQTKEKVDGFKGQQKLTIAPGESFATSCTDQQNRKLFIKPMDVSPTYPADITMFEFKDIIVAKAL